MGVAVSTDHPAGIRVQPRVWIGLAVYVGYVAVVFLVQAASGIPYTALDESGTNLFFGAGLSLIVGSILLALTATLLGWWRPAMTDRRRSRSRWPIVAPILMAIGLVTNLAIADWSAFDAGFFAASLVLLLVGFSEEITTRGLLLVGLRSRLSEGWVWFLTSALFGVMHMVNVLTGQEIGPTVQQVLLAFGAGTIFYVLRRVTGSLIWAMVLHGLWDFSVFALGHGSPNPLGAIGAVVEIAAIVLALIGVPFVVRNADERLLPLSPERRAATAR